MFTVASGGVASDVTEAFDKSSGRHVLLDRVDHRGEDRPARIARAVVLHKPGGAVSTATA